MNYFFANLGAHVLIASALLAVCCIFADKVRKRKADKMIKYFLPLVLTVIIIIYASLIIVPRMFDIRNVVSNNYQSQSGTVEYVAPLKKYIVVDGVKYYKNPSKDCPEAGDKITLKYAETSRFMPEWQPKK